MVKHTLAFGDRKLRKLWRPLFRLRCWWSFQHILQLHTKEPGSSDRKAQSSHRAEIHCTGLSVCRGKLSIGRPVQFRQGETEFEKLRATKAGLATPSHNHTFADSDALGSAEAIAGGAGSPSIGSTVQHQQTRGVHLQFAKLVPIEGCPTSIVSQSMPLPFSSIRPALLESSILPTSIPRQAIQ